MSEIRLQPPEIAGQVVTFRWEVEPAEGLYRRTHFRLELPESVDPQSIAPSVWWRVGLICLHPQWSLMAPRRVVLPVSLEHGEREFWERMIAAQRVAVAALGGTDGRRCTELVEAGPPLEPLPHLAGSGPPALCFSGGRDSLVHLGLLTELGTPPVLVSTTSPREGSVEHATPRRAQVLAEAARRREVELVEVRSDLRGAWHNDWSAPLGLAVNEVSDCFLYMAVALVVAAARGSSRVVMASEFEVQEAWRTPGGIAQHRHFMYSATTQSCLERVLQPTGIRFGGLTSSLQQFQVQRLLLERYPELADLQYSCWELGMGQGACSLCEECRNNAFNLLAEGVDPATIQIDLAELLAAQAGWVPPVAPTPFDEQLLRSLRGTDRDLVRRSLERASPARSAGALAGFDRLAAVAREQPAPAEPGCREGYLDQVDEPLRSPVRAIFSEHFAPEPPERYAEQLALSETLGRWIRAPLDRGDSTPGAQEPDQIGHLIPAPEPPLSDADGEQPIRVADTRLDGNERTYVDECLRTNWISSAGPFVGRFEAAFAEAVGCQHAVACSSGATALELSFAAAGLGPGDEVIVPAFTMVATANAVVHVGATPVFVDSDPSTWNLDLGALRAAIGPRTRAICPVHTYGQPVDMDELGSIAAANRLTVVEDAAQAHGAECRGRPVGSLAQAAAFSFYGNKILTTGEGGMVTTNDLELAATARELRDHGFSPERHFWHRLRAHNFRISNLQAAVGLAQVERLDELLAARRRNAARYLEGLTDVPGLEMPPDLPGLESTHWMFGILVGPEFGVTRDELRYHLAARGVETRTFFVPLHIQPAYISDHAGRRYPVAERLGRTGLYLPSGPTLTERDVERVVDAVLTARRLQPA